MATLVECVPNFSEGRDKAKVDAIVEAMKMDGVFLLDREMDADHNRCVITLVGEREPIQEAAIRGVGKAADLIDLNHVVAGVVALTQSEAQRNRVKLEMQLAIDLPAVVGDPVQLQQVILNLILNGVDATGAVADGPRELVVSTETDAGNALVCVRDTGIGFDEAVAKRLFDAFYTTKPAGMGMGLAISRSIIESHRGRIWGMPNAPRGAVFRFSLPAARA